EDLSSRNSRRTAEHPHYRYQSSTRRDRNRSQQQSEIYVPSASCLHRSGDSFSIRIAPSYKEISWSGSMAIETSTPRSQQDANRPEPGAHTLAAGSRIGQS